MSTPTPPQDLKRRQQIAQAYRMTKKHDRAVTWWLLGAFVVGAALGFGLFWLLPGDGVISLVLSIVAALSIGLLATMIVFSRRAQRAAYGQWEGQVGAAAAALQMLRRGWKLDTAVGFTKQQDIVHRVVGPPGIVLVGEGHSHARVQQLLVNEKRKHARVSPDTPIHEVICGNGDDEVPLPKLVRHVQKLGRQVKPAEVTDVIFRLKALDAQRGTLPIPKGPVPTSMKGQRGNLRGR